VTKHSDGTIVVTNTDNGTTTVQKPDGTIVTTDTKGNTTTTPAPKTSVDPDGGGETRDLKWDPIRAEKERMILQSRPNTGPGDVDPVEDPSVVPVGTGTPVDMKQTLLGGDRRFGDDTAGRSGEPSLAQVGRMPGDVDPTEDTMTNTATGPEDDPLGDTGRPSLGLTGTVSRSSSQSEDEEEDDDEDEPE
jgi:hypothetical protein